MLNNIFQAIDKRANETVQRILKEKERSLFDLEKQHSRELEKRRKEEKGLVEKQIKEEIEEFKQKKELEVHFQAQKEKNKIIKKVYENAKREITGLEDRDFESLVKKLLRFIPGELEGEMAAGRRTANVLRKVLAGEKIPIRDNLDEEGFVLKSPVLEIDMRISQILKELQEKTGPEVIKILFG